MIGVGPGATPEAASGLALGLRHGVSFEADPARAVADLARQVDQPAIELVAVFCSPTMRDRGLAKALDGAFGEAPVVGCTTAGELSRFGYSDDAACAVSFAAPDFRVSVGLLPRLSRSSLPELTLGAESLLDRFLERERELDSWNEGPDHRQHVGVVLIDGLSQREEAVMSCLSNVLGAIPVFGASAGDDMRFERTSVLHRGRFVDDAAVVAMLSTDRPCKLFRCQHFAASNDRMVITAADPDRRLVFEINASPASEEYARLTGVEPDGLTPEHIAANPLVVRLGGSEYVRAVQKVNADGSMSFYAAIDQGLVLTLAQSGDSVGSLKRLFEQIRVEIGEPEAVLGFECVLRKLELERVQQKARVQPLFERNRVIGFSTFGEQFASMHFNQTFTGLAIGPRAR